MKSIPVNEYMAQTRDVVPMSEHMVAMVPPVLRIKYYLPSLFLYLLVVVVVVVVVVFVLFSMRGGMNNRYVVFFLPMNVGICVIGNYSRSLLASRVVECVDRYYNRHSVDCHRRPMLRPTYLSIDQ